MIPLNLWRWLYPGLAAEGDALAGGQFDFLLRGDAYDGSVRCWGPVVHQHPVRDRDRWVFQDAALVVVGGVIARRVVDHQGVIWQTDDPRRVRCHRCVVGVQVLVVPFPSDSEILCNVSTARLTPRQCPAIDFFRLTDK